MKRCLQKSCCYGNRGNPREPKIDFVMLHRLISKVITFQLPALERFSTVHSGQKHFGAIMPPSMSNRVNIQSVTGINYPLTFSVLHGQALHQTAVTCFKVPRANSMRVGQMFTIIQRSTILFQVSE